MGFRDQALGGDASSSDGVSDRRRIVAGALVVVLALPVGVLLARWPGLQTWSESLDSVVQGRGGPWRLMRGGLAYIVIPALLAAGAWVVFRTWRRDHRNGLVLAGAIVAANVAVQIVKHPLVGSAPAVTALDPLSGHVGVSGAVVLAWAMTVRPEKRGSAAVTTTVVISLIGVGVVLAGWHTVAQVVCPFLFALGWMTVAVGLLSPAPTSDLPPARWPGLIALSAGSVVAAVSFAIAVTAEPPTDETVGRAVLCLTGMVVGLVSAGVGAMFLPPPRSRGSRAVSAVRSAQSTADTRHP